MKTIHRSKLTENFTTLPNKLLRGKHLSFTAKGILAMMLSHSQEWELDMKDLSDYGFEGRRRIRKAVQELESAGYATRKTMKNATGGFTGVVWTWRDEPVSQAQRTSPNDRKRSDRKRSQIRILLQSPISEQSVPKEAWQVGSGAELFKGLLDIPQPTNRN